jgi:chondroitin 4-sulfotransferase 11
LASRLVSIQESALDRKIRGALQRLSSQRFGRHGGGKKNLGAPIQKTNTSEQITGAMLISHKHKFIFIHIQKTAGTSISSALEQFCEESYPSIKHWNARKIKEKFGAGVWDEYFKFSFVRNPYERLLSWYNMIDKAREITGHNPNPFHLYIQKNIHSFSEFILNDKVFIDANVLRWRLAPQRIAQFQRLSEGGRIIVDFVGKYENVNEDFGFICRKLNIEGVTLPHINRCDHGHYMNYYTKEIIGEVNSFAEEDFIHFYTKEYILGTVPPRQRDSSAAYGVLR